MAKIKKKKVTQDDNLNINEKKSEKKWKYDELGSKSKKKRKSQCRQDENRFQGKMKI